MGSMNLSATKICSPSSWLLPSVFIVAAVPLPCCSSSPSLTCSLVKHQSQAIFYPGALQARQIHSDREECPYRVKKPVIDPWPNGESTHVLRMEINLQKDSRGYRDIPIKPYSCHKALSTMGVFVVNCSNTANFANVSVTTKTTLR